jgi:tRNA G10  N-methylase Trm11
MAPDIALLRCRQLPPGATVLDPMTGSGTVLRAAVDEGLCAIGLDVDPLAVLMARVGTTAIDRALLDEAAVELVARAEGMAPEVNLPWIDENPETSKFVDFWFAKRQQHDLRRLSAVLLDQPGAIGNALRIALSRLIVTKDAGASLARDVSHSRPHRVRTENDFAVVPAFLRSVHQVGARLAELPPGSSAVVLRGDARIMTEVPDASVDAVITSPPYLNALDYLRGHRLALVWLGYMIRDLRAIRASSIGAERMLDPTAPRGDIAQLAASLGPLDDLSFRARGMIDRFLLDIHHVLREVRRVLKPCGDATFVVANSCLQGVFIDNAAAVTSTASMVGLALTDRQEREIPPSRRYLPPPSRNEHTEMKHRMRTEVVLTFAR